MADETGPAMETEDEESPPPARAVPMGIVVARILMVSGIGVAGALAIFLLVGGLWLPGLAALAATVLFLFFMFAIERAAE